MIELEQYEDIADIYIEKLYKTDKTVGLIAGKELIEYTMDCVLALDETSVKLIDLSGYAKVEEYILYVNDDGCVTVMPIEDYGYVDECDIVYINMDGDVEQEVIDYCVNEDKDVILFGLEDDNCTDRDDRDDCDDRDDASNCKHCCCDDKSSLCTSTSRYTVNGNEVSKEEYSKALDKINKQYYEHIHKMLLDYCEFADEMNEWRKLLRW